MWDLLKLFQMGRSHMAVLTQPEVDDEEDQEACGNLGSSVEGQSPGLESTLAGEQDGASYLM
jgi:hypothetical protein